MIYEEWLENEDDVSSEQNGETSTWIALADLMTGLMAIFLVMFLIMMTQQGRTRVVICQWSLKSAPLWAPKSAPL